MEFEELYSRIIKLWPENIDISDGHPTEGKGFVFPTLNKIYDTISERIDFENDHWANIGIWSFYQAFHDSAQKLIESGKAILNTRKIEKQVIDKKIKATISPHKWSDEWAKERNIYKGL